MHTQILRKELISMTFSAVNTIWVLVGAALVFFMQAGFSLCEAGFTRAKNTGNILMKNLMDFCIGTPCFWLVGFGFMFGSGTALFGTIDPLIMGDYSHILPAGGAPVGLCHFPDGVLRHLGHHRLRRHGGAHQVLRLLYLLGGHLPDHLPHFRPLDLGRRLAFAAGLPRFRRFHRGAHGGRPVRFDRRQNPGAPHWQV